MFSEDIIHHSQLLYDSFFKVTGKVLLEPLHPHNNLVEALYHAPFVLLSHGTQLDPVFNYANLIAQQLWKMDWAAFTQLPSRLSAEPIAVAERQAMLEQVRKKGFIDHYQGVRISRTGKKFIIKDAILWNVYDREGTYRDRQPCLQRGYFFSAVNNPIRIFGWNFKVKYKNTPKVNSK